MSVHERDEPDVTGWQVIGQVGVDSGQLVLVDPQYAEDVAGYVMDTPLTFESVANGLAVVVSTGVGDGVYPVEARFEEVAGIVRVAEVRVRFMEVVA